MIKYGLISETDGRTIEKTIDLICDEFIGDEINVTEIGVFDGQTARGIYTYVRGKIYSAFDCGLMDDNNFEHECNYTAIDNNKDKEVLKPFPECKLIIGNSNEVYNQLEDNSQHMIFLDANHSFASVVQDWFCYESKVKMGGYFLLHDTGEHIKPFKDYQGYGSKGDSDYYISVRKALTKMGLMDNDIPEWRLIFDEADKNNEAGGISVFKKVPYIK